ncbi:TonB-dependent receptor domain-containing protein [Parahaliea mediterranea]|uniref:TonB-dependent receptor n=1 Tax=Parahaliea mediterranea TaxID=651086 RepID=A0A939IPH6_9GAMM|nr:TonB-dependent receptor [Parahaliea mediterranea]
MVVTARKRVESLQDTPISISAFRGEDLNALSISDLTGISRATPNLDLSSSTGDGGGSNIQATIRGIGQTDFLITTDPGVGIYMDGVYLGRATGANLDLLDVERIEVLRGPQGTLFGRNTIGGAISVITSKPAPLPEGSVRLTTGRYNRQDIHASLSGPLVADTLGGSLSLASNQRDGYADRVDGREAGDIDQQLARGALYWTPTSNLEASLKLDYSKQNQESVPMVLAEVDEQAPLLSLWNALVSGPQGTAITGAHPQSDMFHSDGTGVSVNDHEIWGVSATLEWDIGDLTLKSISAYRDLDAVFGRDTDNSSARYAETRDTVSQDQFSQEFQLQGSSPDARLNWVAGAYYYHEEAVDRIDVMIANGLYDALEGLPASVDCLASSPPSCMGQTPGVPGGAGNPTNAVLDLMLDDYNKIETDSYAVFGQGSYDLDERVSVTLGLRYSYDDKSYTLDHYRLSAGEYIFHDKTVAEDFTATSGRVGLDYTTDDGTLLYVSASYGYKSGGFNGRPTAEGELQSFDPEYLWSYEMGAKSQFFDDRLRLNAAAFQGYYEDIQLLVLSADPDTGTFLSAIQNAGEAEIRGMEVEVSALLGAHFQLDLGSSYLHSKYTDIGAAEGIDENSYLPRTPRWSHYLAASYQRPLLDSLDLKLRLDYQYQSKMYMDVINTESIARDSLGLWNVRASLLPSSESYELAMFVTNLTGEAYIDNGVSALSSVGVASAIPGRPREWGLEFNWHF